MNPLRFSSGNLIADRRAGYAEMLLAAGDIRAAAELMAEAVALVPGWVAGHYRLGEMRAEADDMAGAHDAWRACLRLDPADRLGASLKLELHGALSGLDTAPSAFVETLFDQYAETFDEALVEKLAYRVPELLEQAVLAVVTGPMQFAHVVDLGCGTGLMGERLRRSASFIEGFDLSAEMLRKAEAKGLYDRLGQADLQTLSSLPRETDLVTAADVFMYLGALDRVIDMVAAHLSPGALFAFSVEKHDGPGDLQLRPSRRYAHAPAYIARVIATAGFDLVSEETAVIRMDRGEPIEGLIVVARKAMAADGAAEGLPRRDAKERPPAH
ncbi:methyltransferase domain-containing protein [Nitratireductor luteus]|uniref:methyltransferase domain-containing protein n=1 Tax=Nitratireductor luteus TaxID=2976980 RepID=UPI00223EC7BB|nr:methyltransferase domain-containing protein [Nitratireductor luteus]